MNISIFMFVFVLNFTSRNEINVPTLLYKFVKSTYLFNSQNVSRIFILVQV